MDAEKRAKLESAGWKVGTVDDFLEDLEAPEDRLVDMDYAKAEVNLLNTLMVKLDDYHNRRITERDFRKFVAEFLDAKG